MPSAGTLTNLPPTPSLHSDFQRDRSTTLAASPVQRTHSSSSDLRGQASLRRPPTTCATPSPRPGVHRTSVLASTVSASSTTTPSVVGRSQATASATYGTTRTMHRITRAVTSILVPVRRPVLSSTSVPGSSPATFRMTGVSLLPLLSISAYVGSTSHRSPSSITISVIPSLV